jgi:hypothetical protein
MTAGRLQTALGAVVTVGKGRGFIVEAGRERCVWCECLFADPVADIALLGSPDNQALSDEAEDYEALVEAATPLPIAEPASQPIPEEVAKLAALEEKFGMVAGQGRKARRRCSAFLLSLKNQWFSCTVEHAPNGMLDIQNAGAGIAGGMSGSPIVAEDGTAIGVICLGEGCPNPRLMGNLPGWFLNELKGGSRTCEAISADAARIRGN